MNITPEGKTIFDAALEKAGKEVVRIALVSKEEDGSEAHLSLDLAKKDEVESYEDIDGVLVSITEEARVYLESAVFDAEGPNLKVTVHHSCGCGHHHHHDGCGCHEDGCDCGEEKKKGKRRLKFYK
jgi:lactate dehydrogenase-like 2-hydroxyacid dehydrogenase